MLTEDDQHTHTLRLRAPSMTTRHRCISENKHKDKNKDKNKTSSSLSPLYSQLIQKLCSLHCDSCLVTKLDQGTTGALAVYGLPELLKNDSGRIKVKPDLNDVWVHHPVEGLCTGGDQRRQHEEQTIQQDDINDVAYHEEALNDWNSEIPSFKDGDRDRTDGMNLNGVACAYDDDDSIASPIGGTSILQPDSDFFSNSNVSSNHGELQKCTTTTTTTTTPIFQDFSSSLLPPPTPRPRPMELTDLAFEDSEDSLSPSPPHTMTLFSSDWEMEKMQYFNSVASKQQTSDHDVASVLFESTSSSPFLHIPPSVKNEIGLSDPVYSDDLDQDNQPEHCKLLGLDGPRPRTAHGRQEAHPSVENLANSLEKTDLRDEPPLPPAPRLGILSDDFGDEGFEYESEFSAEPNYDSNAIYLYDPFDDSQQDSSSNSNWSGDSEDNLPATPSPRSPEEHEKLSYYSKSYPSPPPSPNPFLPPGLPLRPPKRPKTSPTHTSSTSTPLSSYALSEKSQWKLSVTQFQRSLLTRGMRHPGFPPSPLGPNWDVYHRRV